MHKFPINKNNKQPLVKWQDVTNLTADEIDVSLFAADVDLYVDGNLTIYCRSCLSLRWGKRGRRQI